MTNRKLGSEDSSSYWAQIHLNNIYLTLSANVVETSIFDHICGPFFTFQLKTNFSEMFEKHFLTVIVLPGKHECYA